MEVQSDMPPCSPGVTIATGGILMVFIALVLAIFVFCIVCIQRQEHFARAVSSRLATSVQAAGTLGDAQQHRAESLAATVQPCMLDRTNQYAAFSPALVDKALANCLGQELDAISAFNPSAARDTAAFAESVGYPTPEYTRIIPVAPQP